MRARVLLLGPGLFGQDGVASVTRQMARAILSTGAGLHVIALADKAPAVVPAWLAGARCEFAAGDRSRCARLALSAAAASRPTHVISAHVHLAPLALPCAIRGAEAQVFLHSWEVWGRVSPLRALALRRADRLIANSAHTVHRFLMAHPDCAGRPIATCLLGAEDAGAPEPLPAREIPDRFALIVGRLERHEQHKGHDLLLDLWRDVHARCGLRLVIAGDGSDRTRLEERARALGLAGAVQFAGHVPDAALRALYRDCDLFVMPGRDEGFGLVYVEAMRAGKPCIAGPGAPEEIVVDGETGFVIDPTRRHAVLDAIVRLADDAVLRERMGRAGAARASQMFTEAAFARRFLAAAGLDA
jgi:phosphatidylinositol alpha-1,6-mannosyltransferase